MENEINIAELLKDCPKGMELNRTCADNVVFDTIIEYEQIKCVIGDCHDPLILDKYGRLLHICCPKCVIFPKGKTTWEGFQRPFKDGDILYVRTSNQWICIYKEGGEKENVCRKYVAATSLIFVHDDLPLCHRNNIKEIRLATEEEKAKLFQAIKDNGYKWNSGTKTLEKLAEPNFKVGDRIKHKTRISQGDIVTEIKDTHYILNDESALPFTFQDDYELVPGKFDISTLVPFESRVLVRDSIYDEWKVSFWGCMSDWDRDYKYDTVRGYYKCCIPYESNEHLLGKTEDCIDFYKTWE